MTTFKYSFNNEVFEIDSLLVPKDSLLDIIHRNRQSEIALSSDPNLPYVIWYLENKPHIDDDHTINTLNYWGVYTPYSYESIMVDEEYVRNNMYRPESANLLINTDMYYRLRKMDEFRDQYIEFTKTYTKPDNLTFESHRIDSTLSTYILTVERLNIVNFMFDLARKHNINILIAGEFIYDVLKMKSTPKSFQQTSINNVDVFLVASSLYDVASFIDSVGDEARSVHIRIKRLEYTRNTHSISVVFRSDIDLKINIILKLYKTYSEVLHSFDVDCRCVGYDGTDVWTTERGRYALLCGYNTVNLNIASRFYDYTLLKYEQKARGMGIYIPDASGYEIEYDASNMAKRINLSLYLDDFSLQIFHANEYVRTHVNDFATQRGLSLILIMIINYPHGLIKRRILADLSDYELEMILTSNKPFWLDANIFPYSQYIKVLYSKANQHPETLIELDSVLEYYGVGEVIPLPNRYNVKTNNPIKHDIIIIQQYANERSVIDSVTIDEDVYAAMEVYGNIQLSRGVNIIIEGVNTRVTSVFGEMSDQDKEDWIFFVVVERSEEPEQALQSLSTPSLLLRISPNWTETTTTETLTIYEHGFKTDQFIQPGVYIGVIVDELMVRPFFLLVEKDGICSYYCTSMNSEKYEIQHGHVDYLIDFLMKHYVSIANFHGLWVESIQLTLYPELSVDDYTAENISTLIRSWYDHITRWDLGVEFGPPYYYKAMKIYRARPDWYDIRGVC